MDELGKALENCINTACDLAESVKRNIAHGGVIDNETVAKLNAFTIAMNIAADLNIKLTDNENEDNLDFN